MGFWPARSQLAVKMRFPDKQVMDIAGDGSIQMNIQELATAAQYKINVKIVSIETMAIWEWFAVAGIVLRKNAIRITEYELTLLTFVKLAEAYGVCRSARD